MKKIAAFWLGTITMSFTGMVVVKYCIDFKSILEFQPSERLLCIITMMLFNIAGLLIDLRSNKPFNEKET